MKAETKKIEGANERSAIVPVRQRIQREIVAWFWVALVFMLINGTIGQARVIPSGSMENTMLVGDHLIMSRIGYDAGVPFTNWHVPLWRNPHRQQVIIFKPPFAPEHHRLDQANHRLARRHDRYARGRCLRQWSKTPRNVCRRTERTCSCGERTAGLHRHKVSV